MAFCFTTDFHISFLLKCCRLAAHDSGPITTLIFPAYNFKSWKIAYKKICMLIYFGKSKTLASLSQHPHRAVSATAACMICHISNSPLGKIPCRRKWQPTPVFLPGESHGQRSLTGPPDRKSQT